MLFVHPCISFHCPYSRRRILVRSLYTPASVFTVLIHIGLFYLAVCTPLHQFPLPLFTCTYFSAMFVHPCLSFHCPYSHARILVRCLYTPAPVSIFLIHMHVFYCAVCTSLTQFPLSLFTRTYLIFCSHSQYESESRYCKTRHISVAATLFTACQTLD
jgi:hypothetical protein